jgi:hypothetical protein
LAADEEEQVAVQRLEVWRSFARIQHPRGTKIMTTHLNIPFETLVEIVEQLPAE